MARKAAQKPRKGRLKVFRTAIGFHDAYVAAPSRKAALAAWGTDKDLFARGAAEEVNDPALMEEPLSSPGTVFRQMRAMPPEEPQGKPGKSTTRKAANDSATKHSMQPVPPAPPPPRPSDQEVKDAQQAVDTTRKQHEQEQRDLAARERELASERRVMEARQASELRQLEGQLSAARKEYEKRFEAWRRAIE